MNVYPPEILNPNLPVATALRAAAERGQVLQTNWRVTLLHDRLLRGFARIVGEEIPEEER